MDKLIKDITSQDLTGADLGYLTYKKSPVHLYKDLLGITDIKTVVGPNNACFLLFPIQDSLHGHWIGIILHDNNVIEHFDPYGLSWTQEIPYSDDKIVNKNILGSLYQSAIDQGYKVIYNNIRFQVMKDGINTCGKHVACRIRFKYLDLNQYAKLMLNQKQTPDEIVTMLCLFSLDEDQDEKQAVMNVVNSKQLVRYRSRS
jgi:hypothetical protein